MNGQIKNQMSNLTDENIAFLESLGFSIDNNPETQQVETKEEETPKFVFKFEEQFDDEDEGFELSELEEEMKKVLQANSKMMARAKFYISGQDSEGLPYGNFNGAGDRAITMYQPDHPEASTGKNKGKVFYRWSNPKVVGLMNAIFEECGWNPAELLEENKQVGEVKEE